MIADLRKLWQEAFGDTEETLDQFFSTGYSPDRCHYLCENGVPVSALYWFDCELGEQKLAYLYAVATLKTHRGKGLAQRLLAETHEILKTQGYAGAILVPGEPELFAFYQKLGYRKATTVAEIACSAAEETVELQEIDAEEYARLRKAFLPAGSVIQEGATLDYLQTCASFFAGTDFVLSATIEGVVLQAQELLGNTAFAPRILSALGMYTGIFRTPGKGRDFAMYLPLSDDCPQPDYFGLALD